jgi:O-antigen ligase
LLRSEVVKKGTVLTLALSAILLVSLQALGLAESEVAQERISAFGENPNTVASVLSVGMLSLVGLAYGRREIDKKVRLLAWLSCGILLISIVRTGSRGDVIALVIGLLIFIMKPDRLWQNIKTGSILLLVIGSLVFVSYQVAPVRERWERTYFEGEVAGRDYISAAAWEMFLEKPIIGWGPVNHYHELGYRIGKPTMDPHNLYLWLMLETGLLGAIPFFSGLMICWIFVWKTRRNSQGVLPLAMLTLLLLVNIKGTGYLDKYFWIVLAYAYASGVRVTIPRYRRVSLAAIRSLTRRAMSRTAYAPNS